MYDLLFQDSAASYSRPAIFWVFAQPVLVITYRRLGTTYDGKE